MDEHWTANDPQHVERTQAVWDALQAGDFATALDSNSDGVVFENGPGRWAVATYRRQGSLR
jgi:hypothetical protein